MEVLKFFLDKVEYPVDRPSFQGIIPIHTAIVTTAAQRNEAADPKLALLIDRHRGRWLDTLPAAVVPALPVATGVSVAQPVGRSRADGQTWGADLHALSRVHENLPLVKFRSITAVRPPSSRPTRREPGWTGSSSSAPS